MKTHVSMFLVALAVVFVAGCGNKPEKPNDDPGKPEEPAAVAEHAGHGAGPHEGTVADWGGGKYHVEFTVDHGKKEATVYVLGSDEKSPVPITTDKLLLTIKDPALQADLLPVPLPGETSGTSSRFVGTHDGLGIVKEYAGTISGVVDGTPYAGNFSEEAGSGGHSHVHGEDDALVWEGQPVEHAGLQIKLGHHGKQLHAGEDVEAAVSITSDGEPVSDAKVFNSLLSADGKTVLAAEVPTIFEPTTADEPAHYAQGALAIPKDVTEVVIRFRILPSGGDEVTLDITVAVE